jgi:hypothetical protein
MSEVNGKAMTMTKSTSTPEKNLAFGNEILGCDMVEAMLLHHCYLQVALVHPGVDKVGVEETGGMVAEDVGEEVEACHNELNTRAEEHRPLNHNRCLENPSCIVLLGI